MKPTHPNLLGRLKRLVACLGTLVFSRPEVVESARIESFDGKVGVCCSGGGIRSAGFSLGALDSLAKAGVLDDTRYIAAVSGGAYAATGWVLQRQKCSSEDAADLLIGHLTGAKPPGRSASPPPAGVDDTAQDTDTYRPLRRVRTRDFRHRFLARGPGGLPRTVLYMLLLVATGAALIAWATVVVTWPAGRLIGSWVVLRDVDPTSFVLAQRHWTPGASVLALAGLLLLLSPFWKKAFKLSIASAGLGVGLLLILWGFPWAIVEGRRVFEIDQILDPAAIGGASATTAALGYAIKAAINPLQKTLGRLGGVLLGIVVFLFGGKVATDAALGEGFFSGWVLWLVLLVAFVAFFGFVDIQRLSLREVYRSRLQRSFTFDVDPVAGFTSIPTEKQPTWMELTDGPELIICSTVHKSGLVRRGTAADSFTISRSEVRQGKLCVPTHVYLAQLPHFSRHMRHVSSWMAVTGAAFSSAMGIYSLGTTNALMAALNVDLGIWLPNVAKVSDGYERFPWVRLGYLVKEIFGIYDENDDYVFVADGGQWENLGLVELLRRRCMTILCIDASNDEPGSYSTLRAAVALAADELQDDVKVDLSALDGSSDLGGVGRSMVTRLPFTLVPRGANGETSSGPVEGLIYFAKLQLSDDLPKHVRRFARIDPGFPSYSTANQLLDDQQFEYLIEAGRHAGVALASAHALDSLSHRNAP